LIESNYAKAIKNKLTGTIPSEIASHNGLNMIILGPNTFSGIILSQLWLLRRLKTPVLEHKPHSGVTSDKNISGLLSLEQLCFPS